MLPVRFTNIPLRSCHSLQAEIDSILELGVGPSNIIYANPCKTKGFVKHAFQVGVDLMTFDNEPELFKVAELHPNAKMVLRIKVDDSHAVCRFSAKFGAEVADAGRLLGLAKQLGVDVVGVSFHVGSGCEDAISYNKAIADARYVFDLAQDMGFEMTILDLGGGWPGTSNPKVSFEEIAKVCSAALETYFPEEDALGYKNNVTVIAEPGRFYVASAFTLATMIIAKRPVTGEHGEKGMMYYLNDGVYGSFNCTIFDHWVVEPVPFLDEEHDAQHGVVREPHLTTLWGPTCDSMDLIKKDVMLPEMDIGEWLIFKEMGAYTIAAASTFNGFQLPSLKYHLPSHTLEALSSLPAWTRLATVLKVQPTCDQETDESSDELDNAILDTRDCSDMASSGTAFDVDHRLELIAVH